MKLCKIGIHKWSKWETLLQEKYADSYYKLIQARCCEHCNKKKIEVKIK